MLDSLTELPNLVHLKVHGVVGPSFILQLWKSTRNSEIEVPNLQSSCLRIMRANRSGSGVAPFFPIPREPSGVYLPIHIFLFICRLPLLIAFTLTYFLVFSWLSVGSLVKKTALWSILGIPGIWWIDLQIDGVKRGLV